MTPAHPGGAVAGQAGRFGLVGILNTLVDYVVFMALTKLFSIPLERVWIAKLISGAVAMANSFYFNRRWVFRAERGGIAGQAVKFFSTTVVGVFVIQTSLTQFFSSGFPYFGELAFRVAEEAGITALLPAVFTEAFMIKTIAFGLATLGSLSWNFLTYKFWAFRRR